MSARLSEPARIRRIVLIGPVSPPRGGEALAFELLADHLESRADVERVVIDKTRLPRWAPLRSFGAVRVVLLLAARLLRGADGVYLTLGQSRGGVLRDVLIMLAAWVASVPLVLHLHGGGLREPIDSMGPAARRLLGYAYGKASRIIVLGASLRDQLDFVPPGPVIDVVPNAYPADAPPLPDLAGSYAALKVHPRLELLYLSHVLPSKGLFDVLKALSLLGDSVPCTLHFAGAIIPEGRASARTIRRRIDAYAHALGRSRFRIHGTVAGEEKWQLLLRSNVLLLPTSFHAEGQPISIIEAMYAGCAIVATPHRGIPELVAEDRNGWLVPHGDPAAIARRVEWIWENRGILPRVSALNHAEARIRYSPEIFTSRMTAILAAAMPCESRGGESRP